MVKTLGVGASAGLAGCSGKSGSGSGGSSGSGSGGSSGSGGATTGSPGGSKEPGPTDTKALSEMSPEEWRTYVSNKAAEEDGKLKLNFSAHGKKWVAGVANANWHGAYEPLKDNVSYVQTGMTKQVRLYRQQLNAGNVTMGMLSSPHLVKYVDKLDFMKATDIPSYRAAPDDVKIKPYFGSQGIKPYVQVYNGKNISEPPKSFKDYLSPRFEGKTFIVDFTPSPTATAIFYQKVPDGHVPKLKDHYDPKFVKIQPNGTRMVGDGRGDFMHNVTYSNVYIDQQRGYPSKIIDKPEMAHLIPGRLVIAKGTPTPWKAKLWLDWIMGPGKRAWTNAEPGKLTIDRSYANPPKLAEMNLAEGKLWGLQKIKMNVSEAADLYPKQWGYQG